ncbi:hypothetical protein [Phaeacidiphilus oryzae]|uniref:hypothetical protein n=1 Tax=Phaeacidiphilus oryzae TaxID=348818 RepID=UPI00068C750E|nr:hypothetical protein [Phaeacidiphilus oryzae]
MSGRTAGPARAGGLAAALGTAAERGLALLLALAVARPSELGDLPLTVLLLVLAWCAGPSRARRPVTVSYRWWPRLVQHRNTVFAVACVLVAAVRGGGAPPVALAAADTVLLLSYLVLVDARTAGPVGRRRLRPAALLAGYGASALVLVAASADVGHAGHWWARPLAALAIAGAGAALALTQGLRRGGNRPPLGPPPVTARRARRRGRAGTTPRG